MKTKILCAFGALSLAAFSSAQAQTIIYADSFQYGTGFPGINGQTPTIYDGPGATWTGNSGFLFTNGANTALLSTNGDAIAYLPLTLATNTSYTYSLNLAPTGTNSWQEMGFINVSAATPGQSVLGTTDIGPALIFGQGASGIQLFNGAIGSHAVSVPTPSDAAAFNPQTFTFILNTGATLGTYTYSVLDTDSLGNTTTLASNISYTGTISGIELGTFYEQGTISSLVVSSDPIGAVPEPSTLALLGAGVLGLSALQRRMRVPRL